MRTRIYGATAVAMLTGMTVIGAAPAALADVDDQGRCSATSTWDSSLDLERGRWDLEFEVKTAKAGQRWKLTVKQNGAQVYNQTIAEQTIPARVNNATFAFPSFTPTETGEITWTLTIVGDTATATTRVR